MCVGGGVKVMYEETKMVDKYLICRVLWYFLKFTQESVFLRIMFRFLRIVNRYSVVESPDRFLKVTLTHIKVGF